MKTDAKFSDCRRYRYALWRVWDEAKPYVAFIGLNPSTADEVEDDQTMKRCIAFAQSWGYGGVCMLNLFAFKATIPADMKKAADPIGPENNQWMLNLAKAAGAVVAAWGDDGSYLGRSSAVKKMFPDLYALKINITGEPAHPLYLSADLKPGRLERPQTSTEFREHHSPELRKLFHAKPYQGADPTQASIVFLSSDANYSPEISDHAFFKHILDYHEDGVAFWKKHEKHHPFLLSEYPFNKTQNGRPFHNNFSRIGLDSSYAEFISFIELLDIPTIGMKSQNRELFYSYANIEHLKKIDELYLEAGNRLIFVSRGVLNDMLRLRRNTALFSWLPDALPQEKFVTTNNGNKVQEIYHFSSSHIHREIADIRSMIDSWLGRLTETPPDQRRQCSDEDTVHTLQIRPARVEDAAHIHRFISELAIYEKAEHEVVATVADIEQALFGPKKTTHAVICALDHRPIGFAVYFFNFSTWLGKRGVYLEDLYVSPRHRGSGAGKVLLKHLARIAVSNNCGRFEWNVLDWNEPAIQFYRSIGAEPQNEWIGYRLAGDALREFAQS